jgi:hypothetical protein
MHSQHASAGTRLTFSNGHSFLHTPSFLAPPAQWLGCHLMMHFRIGTRGTNDHKKAQRKHQFPPQLSSSPQPAEVRGRICHRYRGSVQACNSYPWRRRGGFARLEGNEISVQWWLPRCLLGFESLLTDLSFECRVASCHEQGEEDEEWLELYFEGLMEIIFLWVGE